MEIKLKYRLQIGGNGAQTSKYWVLIQSLKYSERRNIGCV